LGHSWGSYLGVKTIEKYPENYLAYIGIGQVSNQRESEHLAYEYMVNHAKETGDKDVLEKLENYDPNADDFPSLEYLIKARTAALDKYGIGRLHQGLTFPDIVRTFFVFKGYTLKEKINWFLGADFSMIQLYDRVWKEDNLFESSVKFEIPFYIIHGIYDYNVSYTLSKEYLDVLEAPKKEFFTFDNSAHSPNMEETEKFIEVLREIAMENLLENNIE
jgi:pimeloyl-ACP methyl ester carboxylesterase